MPQASKPAEQCSPILTLLRQNYIFLIPIAGYINILGHGGISCCLIKCLQKYVLPAGREYKEKQLFIKFSII